jgi:hypothetical protein
MLEFLIALATRMNETFYDWDVPDQTGVYFWEMMGNLGLLDYTDKFLEDFPNEVSAIDEAFAKVNYRKYDSDGRDGGLFPIDNPSHNQRETEIWYQMQEYMSKRL